MSEPLTDPTHNVYRNARRLRIGRGWTAAQLAEQVAMTGCPLTPAIVRSWESGRKSIVPLFTVLGLARALGVTIEDLMADPADCRRCAGVPPAGFICRSCGTESVDDAVSEGGRDE